MKLLFTLAIVLGFASVQAFGQGAQGQLIKNKAKGIAADNNARQGIAPGAPGAPAAAAPRQGIDPAQQQNIDKLGEDLKTIRSGAPVTPEQKTMLEDDFMLLAKGTTKPSKTAITKLVNDLTAALSNKNITVKEQAQLAKDINIFVNSANLTAAQVQTFTTMAQNILKSSGVSQAQVDLISGDIKAIVAELQAGKAKP